jgi:hypothetical protein
MIKETRMITDRTTKLLLAAIALALWGLLMRPAFTPIPAKAAGGEGGNLVVVGTGQTAGIYLLSPSGHDLYRFSPNDLSVSAHSQYDVMKDTFIRQAR